MTRVLFFIESLGGGGAEKVLVHLVNSLDRARFDVTLLTVTDGGVWQGSVLPHVHLHHILRLKDARTLRYRFVYHLLRRLPAGLAHRLFLRGNFDVEAAFCEGLATKLIAAGHCRRKICWVHIDPIADPHSDAVFHSVAAQQKSYAKFEQILCVSKGTMDAFWTKFGPFSHLKVQYNPLPTQEILQQAAQSLALPPRQGLVFCAIARLVPAKGVEKLLDACARLQGEGFDCTLWVLGVGPLQAQLELLRPANAHLLGFRQNPYAYLAAADCFVSASRAEGFSTAASEALVLGKPVLALESAGMREVLNDNACGLLGDDIYVLMKAVLEDSKKIDEMKQAAQRRGLVFSSQKQLQEIEVLLDGQ